MKVLEFNFNGEKRNVAGFRLVISVTCVGEAMCPPTDPAFGSQTNIQASVQF